MKKSLSWKVLLIIAIICFASRFVISGGIIGVSFNIIFFISLISGLIGFFKRDKLKTKQSDTIFMVIFLFIVLFFVFLILNPFKDRELKTENIYNLNKEIQSEISPNTSINDVNLQVDCDKEAHNFIVNNYDNNPAYINHFNQRLNVCFIVISDYSSGVLYILADAISNQEYGEYYYAPSVSNASFLTSCVQNNKPNANCEVVSNTATSEDWSNFIRPYMEN
jgi:hypothetical protein